MIKYYVINLKRKPLRLGHWIGWQSAKDLNIEGLTIVEAVDKEDMKDMMLLHAWGVRHRFENRVDLLHYHSISIGKDDYDMLYYKEFLGVLCLRLTQDILLCHIRDTQPAGSLHNVWVDDEVLSVEYPEYKNNIEAIKRVKDFDILSMRWYHHEHLDPDKERWNQRENYKHESGLFYQGTANAGFNHCFVVTPLGAAALLKLGENDPEYSYLDVVFEKHNLCQSEILTSAVPMTIGVGYLLGSDVIGDSGTLNPEKIVCIDQG